MPDSGTNCVTDTGILLLQSLDRKGIVAAVSTFIYERNGNIVNADEHQDPDQRMYFLRLEWDLSDFTVSLAQFSAEFARMAADFGMRWQVARSSYRPKVAIFVSKAGHCLADLL